jgi:hypothetical protein
MKNFTKLLFFVIAFAMATESFGQTFGIRGGLNLSTQLVKDDNNTFSDNFKMNPGFHVGLTAEFPVTEMFAFETGVLYSTKGYKIDEETSVLGQTIKTKGYANLGYIEIPLTLKVSSGTGGINIYGDLGPYIGMGISGKTKFDVTALGVTTTDKNDVKWGSGENDDFKSLDFGLTAGAGVKINAIQLGIYYDLGLANISPSTTNGRKINNRVLGLSMGIQFGGK